MDESILNNGVTFAKAAEVRLPLDEALLARLRNNSIPQDDILPYQLPPAEFQAHIDACIAAARGGRPAPASCGDDDELDDAPVPPVPAPAPTDGLKTQAQAARRLGISIRTLRGLVSAGDLRYVNVGHGKQREKIMFTDSDLDDLIASRTRQKAQQSCQSISPKARRSTTSTSSGAVLAFTARRNGQTGGKRKP